MTNCQPNISWMAQKYFILLSETKHMICTQTWSFIDIAFSVNGTPCHTIPQPETWELSMTLHSLIHQ